ncbi:hypothetical protein [Sinomonas sp.]|uniref:hypothetical protein n=1 Tax=Sinomonas sp. TaxID=1914986 RepID=UPI002FE0C04E
MESLSERIADHPPATAPRWRPESLGALVALALALLAVWHMDATGRSWILYYESDTVLPALVRGSVLAGQPQDWSLSAVLFIPEMGLYFAIAGLGFGIKGTFALNAVVNLLLFYGSLRLLSGFVQRELTPSRRVAGALVAFGVLVSLTLLEDSPRPDSFELASLLATATYYSATVLASVLATGIVSSLATAAHGRRRRLLEFALIGLSTAATLTNPLFLAWEAVPLAGVLALLARRRVVSWFRLVRLCALLAAGAGLGFAGRIPFEHLIAKDGLAYVDPRSAPWLALYYPEMLADRASTPVGALSLGVVVALILVSAIVFRKSLAAGDVQGAIVSGMGWVAPVAVVVGAICLGAFGTRYLQPMFFAPVCTVVFIPRLFVNGPAPGHSLPARTVRALLAGTVALCLAFSGIATGALSRSAAAVDPDIRCVDEWISASHRTGAGYFWTIRGPKAYLAEPDQLIQIDDPFRAFPWLTDRTDYGTRRVSFVLSVTAYALPILPSVAAPAPRRTVSCGRYTITDFGSDILPIAPAAADATS